MGLCGTRHLAGVLPVKAPRNLYSVQWMPSMTLTVARSCEGFFGTVCLEEIARLVEPLALLRSARLSEGHIHGIYALLRCLTGRISRQLP